MVSDRSKALALDKIRSTLIIRFEQMKAASGAMEVAMVITIAMDEIEKILESVNMGTGNKV